MHTPGSESRPPRRTGRARLRRLVAGVLACSLIAAACSDDGSDARTTDASAGSTADGSGPAASEAATGTSMGSTGEAPAGSADEADTGAGDGADRGAPVAGDALESVGIQVVEEAIDLTEITAPLVLTRVQSDRLLADVDPANGIAGADLDAVATMPVGVAPISWFVAAWVSTAETPAAALARDWMGDQDWANAPSVRFPEAVLALFVNDLATSTAAEVPDDESLLDLAPLLPPGPVDIAPAGLRAQPTGALADPQARLDGVCSTVVNFIGASLGAIVNALHITPPASGDFLGTLGAIGAFVFNNTIGLAAQFVQGLINELTAPVVAAIRTAIAVVGVITVFASMFRDEKVNVKLRPTQRELQYRFAIGSEGDITGQFVATSDSLTGRWPAVLEDCANALGTPLPTPAGPGERADWTVEQPRSVIAAGELATTVGTDLAARLSFATLRESEEDAKGQETNSAAFVTVKIRRTAVEDLLRLGRQQVDAARATILSLVPIPGLSNLAAAAFDAVVGPVLARVDAEISDAARGVFGLTGRATVFVSFHEPPDTTTSSSNPEPTEPPADFCTKYRELVAFSATLGDDIVGWATEIVRRLDEMRPLAPADLLDEVDVERRVYQAVAESASILVLIETTEPLPEAAAALGVFCGVSGA